MTLLVMPGRSGAQTKLSTKWEELTAGEFKEAIVKSQGTCLLPQIFEAKHEPGTIAYSPELQLCLLQETTDEMARNGCKKVVIVNAHGGNEYLLPYFAQSQLYKPHDYVVYVQWDMSPERKPRPRKAPQTCTPAKRRPRG